MVFDKLLAIVLLITTNLSNSLLLYPSCYENFNSTTDCVFRVPLSVRSYEAVSYCSKWNGIINTENYARKTWTNSALNWTICHNNAFKDCVSILAFICLVKNFSSPCKTEDCIPLSHNQVIVENLLPDSNFITTSTNLKNTNMSCNFEYEISDKKSWYDGQMDCNMKSKRLPLVENNTLNEAITCFKRNKVWLGVIYDGKKAYVMRTVSYRTEEPFNTNNNMLCLQYDGSHSLKFVSCYDIDTSVYCETLITENKGTDETNVVSLMTESLTIGMSNVVASNSTITYSPTEEVYTTQSGRSEIAPFSEHTDDYQTSQTSQKTTLSHILSTVSLIVTPRTFQNSKFSLEELKQFQPMPGCKLSCVGEKTKICSESTCQCKKGYAGTLCEMEKNSCDPNPCYQGKCTKKASGGFNCKCPEGWTGEKCDQRSGFPSETNDVINYISRKLGTTVVFMALIAVFIFYTISLNFTTDGVLKLCIAACLLAAYTLIQFFGDPSQFKINHLQCNIVALLTFFFFCTSFTFLDIHSRHTYYWATGVSPINAWGYSKAWYIWTLVALSYPIFVTAFLASYSFASLSTPFSCWINYNGVPSRFMIFLIMPIISAVINTEATGMDMRFLNAEDLLINDNVINLGYIGSSGNVFIIPFVTMSYFIGSFAFQHQFSLAATLLMPVNALMALFVFCFYFISNVKAFSFVKSRVSKSPFYKKLLSKLESSKKLPE